MNRLERLYTTRVSRRQLGKPLGAAVLLTGAALGSAATGFLGYKTIAESGGVNRAQDQLAAIRVSRTQEALGNVYRQDPHFRPDYPQIKSQINNSPTEEEKELKVRAEREAGEYYRWVPRFFATLIPTVLISTFGFWFEDSALRQTPRRNP